MSSLAWPAPPLTLRPLSLRDAPALQAVYLDSADFFLGRDGVSPGPDQAAVDLAAAAQDDACHILGIFLEDQIVGAMDLRFDDPEPLDTRLGLILLTPARRRQGLGTWALRIFEAWLGRDTPTEAVVATVPAQNHAAQRFFAANDYSFTGQSTRVLIADTRRRLLVMRKAIRTDA